MNRLKLGPGGFFPFLLVVGTFCSVCLPVEAAIGDDAQLVSVSIPTDMQIMPRTMFTQTWTFKNIGTNTWTPTQSGYTLNMQSVDSLGAIRIVPNTSSSANANHPKAIIDSGISIPPGGQASYSLIFITPETPGTVTDLFQLNSASSQFFGPTVSVQVVVMQAGNTNQYDRARAVSYANNYAAYVVTDGCFWTNGSTYVYYGAGAPVPTNVVGDDCAHFVSCCIGSETNKRGGGLIIPSRAGTYGEPGATRLVTGVLIGAGWATEVASINMLSPGDVIGWNWSGNNSISNLDHVTMYVGNGEVASHAATCLGVSGTTWYQSKYPNLRAHYIHIFDAPTLASARAGNKLVLSWGTNWASYRLYSATSASPNAAWTKVSSTPKVVGNQNMVTNTIGTGAVFYRLSMP